MTKREKPPREWEIDDLWDLGRREGDKALYLKAIPVLILENWIRGGREKGSIANYARTKELARRIVECGLHPPFKPKGTSNILAAMAVIQRARNLTQPILIEYERPGWSSINLPYYEPLLQEYRQKYLNEYPDDYKKLFPEEELEWDPTGGPVRKSLEVQPKPLKILQVL